jgi:hypothetical protein
MGGLKLGVFGGGVGLDVGVASVFDLDVSVWVPGWSGMSVRGGGGQQGGSMVGGQCGGCLVGLLWAGCVWRAHARG